MRTRSHIIGKSGACKYSALWRGAESSLAKFPHREGRGTVTQRQGRERRGGRPYAPTRVHYIILLLYAQFQQRCVRNRTFHSLTQSSSPLLQISSGSPRSRNFAKRCGEEGGSNCVKIASDGRSKIAAGREVEIATPFHLPCILQYRWT